MQWRRGEHARPTPLLWSYARSDMGHSRRHCHVRSLVRFSKHRTLPHQFETRLLSPCQNGSSGLMGVKSIAKHLNEAGIRTRDGGRWGVDAVHKVLTRTTYIGRHRFNTKFWKTRAQTRHRGGRDGRAADRRYRRVRGRTDTAQDAQTRTDRTAHCQRAAAPYRQLLLRLMRRGNDAEDRKERKIQVLHLLHP